MNSAELAITLDAIFMLFREALINSFLSFRTQ